jgi:hypothetical protein
LIHFANEHSAAGIWLTRIRSKDIWWTDILQIQLLADIAITLSYGEIPIDRHAYIYTVSVDQMSVNQMSVGQKTWSRK